MAVLRLPQVSVVLRVFAALCCVAVSAVGGTNVLNFDVLEESGLYYRYVDVVYRESGFVVTSLGGYHGQGSFQTGSEFYTGSAGLFNNTIDDWTSLSKSNAGRFDLLGITLARGSIGPPSVTFFGYRGNSNVVTQTLSVTTTGRQAFVFIGFTNLSEVRWQQVSPGHQFDDVVLNSDERAPPPPLRMMPVSINSVFRYDLINLRVGAVFTIERSTNLIDWTAIATESSRTPWVIQGDFIWQRTGDFYRAWFSE